MYRNPPLRQRPNCLSNDRGLPPATATRMVRDRWTGEVIAWLHCSDQSTHAGEWLLGLSVVFHIVVHRFVALLRRWKPTGKVLMAAH